MSVAVTAARELLIKLQAPKADPSAMWLVHDESGAFKALLHKGSVPPNVQEASIKNNGKVFFNVTVVGKTISTWGAQAAMQTW